VHTPMGHCNFVLKYFVPVNDAFEKLMTPETILYFGRCLLLLRLFDVTHRPKYGCLPSNPVVILTL